MTATVEPAAREESGEPGRRRRRWIVPAVAAIVAAVGLGVGVGTSVHDSRTPTGSTTAYRYYQSVMGRFGAGAMMGGSVSGGQAGYGWMMGGAQAPGWMAGSALPGSMMGSATDPGEAMGSLFADAPGPRVSTEEAASLARLVPAGASVDRAANRLTFTGPSVTVTVVSSPPGADDRFEVAGLIDPTVAVDAAATVSVRVVNADTTSAHGLVVTNSAAPNSWMPMMTSRPAFAGADVWFLGDATPAGAHTSTATFITGGAGAYRYLCPVPGHAEKGMAGTFVVTG